MAETGNIKATVSKFERMSVEELEEAIRIYFEADNLEENMENLLLASEVLDRKKEAMGDRVDTDAQWDRFQRDYLPLLNDEVIEEGDAEKAEIDKIIKITEKAQVPCRGKKRTAKRVFHVVAAAALIVLILGLTACAVIPQVRTCVVNFVMNTFGNNSVIYMDNSDDELTPIAKTETYELNGYSFDISAEYGLDAVVEDYKYSYCIFYSNDSTIVVYVSSSDYSPVQLDTEETETRSVIINGKEGFVIEKGNKKYVTWGDLDSKRIIYVSGEKVGEEILLKIAGTFVPLED